MMAALSPRSRRLAAVGLLVAVVLAVYSFVVGPLLASYADDRREVAQSRAALAHYQDAAREIPELQQKLDALHRQGATGAGYLEGESETLVAAALQERLKSAVVQTGGHLNSTQVLAGADAEAQRGGKPHRIAVRGQMQLSIAALQRVIYTLESGSPYLFVDNLDVRPVIGAHGPETSDSDALLDVHFDVYGYMQGGA